MMCKVLEVSESSYYASLTRPISKQENRRNIIAEKAAEFHADSGEIYGYRKVYKDIIADGKLNCSKETVRRVMHEQQLFSRVKRKFKVCTTDSKHDYKVPENVLGRDFTAYKPNQKWVSDITYIRITTGWVYLAVIIDLFNRQVVGWAVSKNINCKLICKAFNNAVRERGCSGELIFHSDRGVQYAANDFRELVDFFKAKRSMSRKGNCWDNAVAESFFGKLKCEYVQDMIFDDLEEAETRLFWYIEVFYNRKRRHASLGYVSPVEFEKQAKLDRLVA